MESVIALNLVNNRTIRFMEWLKKLLRVTMIAAFFLCLYINCIYGAEKLGFYEETAYEAEIKEKISPMDELHNLTFADFINNPKRILPYGSTDYVKRPHIKAKTSTGVGKEEKVMEVLPDASVMGDAGNGIISSDDIESGKDNAGSDENTGSDDNTDADDNTGDNDSDGNIPVFPTVILHGNGGFPEILEMQLDSFDFAVDTLDDPKRLGKEFDKWYTDSNCTVPFTEIGKGEKMVNLYAGWKEFKGFLSNDKGYITGYTDIETITRSRVLKLPIHESCLGAAPGAFSGLEDYVEDVYVPANIVEIPEGIFDSFYGLIFIQVAQDNPVYKSINGVLYTKDGQLVCMPPGQAEWN